jgi:hypothetical protein
VSEVPGRSTVVCAIVGVSALLQGGALLQSAARVARAGVNSVSDSVNSASDAIGMSTERSVRLERAYRDDVRIAVRDLVEAGATPDNLIRELGRVAELHGISDWEAEPGALIALGAGMCEARGGQRDLDALLQRLDCDAEQRALAREGCLSAAL